MNIYFVNNATIFDHLLVGVLKNIKCDVVFFYVLIESLGRICLKLITTKKTNKINYKK